MTVFLDSSTLIAYFRKPDANNAQAERLVDEFEASKEAKMLTSHVFEEIVTYIQSRDGAERAFRVGQNILKNRNTQIMYAQENHVALALDRLRKFPGFSLCDALTSVLMEKNGIRKLYSFDSDFDRLTFIERLH